MECYQCNQTFADDSGTIIPINTPEGQRYLCGSRCQEKLDIKNDIKFLLSFAPREEPEDLPRGLDPTFYFTLSYEGDMEIAKRIKNIEVKYGI